MPKELGSDRLVLDVKHQHEYMSRDRKRHGLALMFPQRNVKGDGAGKFSIRKDSDTRGQEYVTDEELAELFAINGFIELGINLRMSSVEKYDGGSPPGLQPSGKDVIAGTSFDFAVKEQKSRIQKRGLSASLAAKLNTIKIELPDGLISPNTTVVTPESSRTGVSSDVSGQPTTSAIGLGRPITLEEFQNQLDRRSEIGRAGEQIAIDHERQRLGSKEVGCPDPYAYVKHIALTDVGRGYDIETTWPGHERCIEVKSSTRSCNDIYMSDNEKRVLTELGNRAWLYRVVVDANGDGEVVLRLNDPISKISEDSISTAVWRVCLSDPSKQGLS